jgi:hypothetical protein
MRSLDFGRCVLSISAAAALLAGCGGSQLPIGAPGAMPQTAASHMRKASSSSGDLLYVGSQEHGVFVVSYPQGKIITQFEPPSSVLGMCSDQTGDVFVLTGGGGTNIYEYAHGGTSPIATLEDGYFEPLACAADPATGNLAVVNNEVSTVAIFPAAQGPPTYYNDPNVRQFNYCAYDDSGDLLVDGFKTGPGNVATLAELPYGSSSFTNVTTDKNIGNPGSMQWMGTYLAVGSSKQVIWHINISGSSGIIVGKTKHKLLKSPWTIDGNGLISVYGGGDHDYPSKVALWTYPKGGGPTQLLNLFGNSSRLDGVAVSVGSEK